MRMYTIRLSMVVALVIMQVQALKMKLMEINLQLSRDMVSMAGQRDCCRTNLQSQQIVVVLVDGLME